MQFEHTPNPNPPEPDHPAHEVTWTVKTSSPEPVTWAVWPPGIVTLSPSETGLSATIKTTGRYGTATVRASQGGVSISQFVWVGFLLRYSKKKNELFAMESHHTARMSTKGRSGHALMWSPSGDCFLLNHEFLAEPTERSATARYWIKGGAPQPEKSDPLYGGNYGKGTFFTPTGGQVWNELGDNWTPINPDSPAIAPVLKDMQQLDALIAWAPPATMPEVEHQATATWITCYILNVDLLEETIEPARNQAQHIPVKKLERP
jgi:hypothetical protein